MRWRSFVAMGDSFTEGLDDPYRDGSGYRGWADLVAGVLAEAAAEEDGSPPAGANGNAPLRYANLAVRGRLLPAVVEEQVPLALEMAPDLISFAAGGNDALRRNFDPAVLTETFTGVVARLRASGADVVLFRFADLTVHLPGRRVIGPRVDFMNELVGRVAEEHGAVLVDLWRDREFANPLLWSTDRLHLCDLGHRRVAALVLEALGVAGPPDWLAVPEMPPAPAWLAARGADLRWAGTHLAPWVRRRLTGRSSGDLVTAKRPQLTPVSQQPGG